ncbi:MAG TPA: SpoIIE family protein phosphatase [Thermoanaerobaculia bacterium]|nr:SpoIIE family protein phosphatase [Thermoanaerobaculia bacterium]
MPSEAAAVWHDLASLAGGDAGDDRALLDRLLELWRRALPAAGAAAYLERDGSFVREATSGEGAFPPVVAAAEAEGLLAYRIPGALLLAATRGGNGADSGGDPPQPFTLLLAGELRAVRLRQQLKQQHFEVNYRVVELESVYEVGLAIASTLDLDQLSEEILLRAVSLLDARRAALYRREGDTYRLDRTFGGEALAAVAADDPALAALLAAHGAGPEGLLAGARHLMAVPVQGDLAPRGLIVVGDKESRRGVGPFGASDRRTLSLFANQAAIALENANLHRQALEKQRMDREVELAAEIQREILPDRAPDVPGFELLGWNRPARTVGGDYYDLRRLDGGRIALTVADVSGKGIGAALLVSTLHSALHLLHDRVGLGSELLDRLNRHVLDSSAGNKFITLLVAELDPASGDLTYLNAGHNPGLVLRADGTVEELAPCGMPIGLLPDALYQARSTSLGAGDLLCLYTDGITECSSPSDVEFGVERLIECLTESRHAALADIVAGIDRRTRELAAGQPQLDDQTLVLLRRAG